MGYSHHDGLAVTGTSGLAVGSATAGETRVIDVDGNITAPTGAVFTGSSGAVLDDENATIVHTYVWSTTATQSWYSVAPVTGNITKGFLVHPVAAATTNAVVVNHGTAGASILSFASEAGTVGTISTASATGTVAVTAGELLKITMTATATSVDQVYSTLSIVIDKT